jgi:uncharacterized membrane protein
LSKEVRSRFRTIDARDIALISIFSALMAVTTMWAIPLPFGGITHLGNTVMWTASILFGGLIGGIGGGIGGMIVDLIVAPIWAPFTPFCKLASGLACGFIAGKPEKLDTMTILRIIAATIVGALVNMLAYAPVYYLLLGYNSMLAWVVNFVLPSPTRLVTYVLTPIISIAVIRSYPDILNFRK